MTSSPATQGTLSKTDRTRLRLVAAVRKELEGSGSFNAEKVARRAKASTATFYNHFESQDEAFDAAYRALMDDLVRHVTDGLQVERLLEVGLETFAAQWVAGCVRFFRSNSVLFALSQAKALSSAAVREVYADSEKRAIDHCERFVRLGQSARLFRAGEARDIARAMMILSEGYNNPAVLQMAPGDALHRELGGVIARLLENTDA
ncbi:TetR/AcrR family transcriptional regulator [Litorivivens sp.]|uniref:TetR/AcrR family transcriptional regulator n=2 Tax=Litorivivens sp. TaxID=2020868 RepID=UPI003564275D